MNLIYIYIEREKECLLYYIMIKYNNVIGNNKYFIYIIYFNKFI